MRYKRIKTVAAALVAALATTAHADQVVGAYADVPGCDDHGARSSTEEFGFVPFFQQSQWFDPIFSTITPLSACPGTDDPNQPNALVIMQNITGRSLGNLFYVGDNVGKTGKFFNATTFSNQDGVATQFGDLGMAFRIDSVGVNRPLVFESILADGIMQPDEWWEFIIQDYQNAFGNPPEALWSVGFADGSDFGAGGSTGSVVQFVPNVLINEIRVDQPALDTDEYFELIGNPGDALGGLTYVVVGDGGAGNSGIIEMALDLTGQVIGPGGRFVAADVTFTLGVADMTTSLNFENSDNVTHALIGGFSGASVGGDLDPNDDCILDSAPWTIVLDHVAILEEDNPPVGTECHYGPPSVGPDGTFAPGHVFRCGPAQEWAIGIFDPADPNANDTPGAPNDACPCLADLDGNGDVNITDLLLLFGDWGPCAAPCPADLNGDAVVDLTDMLLMLADWGPC